MIPPEYHPKPGQRLATTMLPKLAYSTRGTYLAYAPQSGGVQIWDSHATHRLGELQDAGKGSFEAFDFDAAESTLWACRSDGHFRSWSLRGYVPTSPWRIPDLRKGDPVGGRVRPIRQVLAWGQRAATSRSSIARGRRSVRSAARPRPWRLSRGRNPRNLSRPGSWMDRSAFGRPTVPPSTYLDRSSTTCKTLPSTRPALGSSPAGQAECRSGFHLAANSKFWRSTIPQRRNRCLLRGWHHGRRGDWYDRAVRRSHHSRSSHSGTEWT